MPSRICATVAFISFASAILIPANPALADSFRDDQWYLKALKVADAHSISKGDGSKIAVIDTGVALHPDLRRKVLSGVNFASGNNTDGRLDQDGHGTSMASIIAAHGKTSRDGVLGIAPRAKILPVKITNNGNSMPAASMAKGVEWATQNGADVINVSAETGPAFALIDAVRNAIQDDIVVVAGVGNTSKQAIMSYPAAVEGVLVVGSVDRKGNHAAFSITNARVQVCAPGVSITSARPEARYVDTDGTSASTAVVSGAVALIRSKFPDLSSEEVVHRITSTADDIGPPGRDDDCGFGRLNIVEALTAVVPPLKSEGKTAAPSASSSASSAPGAVRPEFASPAATSQAGQEASGSNRGLVVGGVVAVLAAAGVLVALVLRRRRRG